MSQEPDYYEVLEVEKTASVEEIKAAYKKAVRKWHPDRFRDETEKKKAEEIFVLISRAHEVLTDPAKRRAYDQGGQAGLDRIKNGGGSSAPGYADAIGQPRERKMATWEDLENAFGASASSVAPAAAPQRPAPASTSSHAPVSEEAAARRAAAAEERRRRMMKAAGGDVSSSPPPSPSPSAPSTPAASVPPRQPMPAVTPARPAAPSATEAFQQVTEGVAKAVRDVKEVALPLEVLENFRENLRELDREVGAAIARARRNNNPRP